MTTRRETVEQTRERILQAAYDAWLELPYDQVTLDAVARDAGTSRQTVLRHFGSKDELALAVVDWQRPREESARRVEPGDIVAAVRHLVDRYETMGDANVRLLELEGRIAPIDHLLAVARDSHRGWIETTFAPFLPAAGRAGRELVMTLYAATDVTVWKLLRRDLGRSRAETEAIIRNLVEGATGTLDPSREDSAMTNTTQRYLLPMWDGGGTVAPGLGVARRLIARGHTVHVLADPTIGDQAEQAGCTFTPWTAGARTARRSTPSRICSGTGRRRTRWRCSRGCATASSPGRPRQFAADTADAIDLVRPDVVAPDYLLFGAILAAQAARLPVVPIVPNIWTLPSPGVPAIGPGFPLAKGRAGRCARRRAARGGQRPVPARPAAAERGPHRTRPRRRCARSTTRSSTPSGSSCSPARASTSPRRPCPPTSRYTGPILDEPAWAEPWTDPGRRPPAIRWCSSGSARPTSTRPRCCSASSMRCRRCRCAASSPSVQMLQADDVAPSDNVDRRPVGAARPDPARGLAGDHPLRARHRHEGPRQRRADGVHPDGPRPERHRRPRRPPRRRRAAVARIVRHAHRGRRARRARRPRFRENAQRMSRTIAEEALTTDVAASSRPSPTRNGATATAVEQGDEHAATARRSAGR